MFRSAESFSIFITAISGLMLAVAVITAVPTSPRESALAYSSSVVDVSTGIPLNAIQNPSASLLNMLVETSKGEKLGEVRAVEVGSSGAVQAVTVATRGLFGLSTVSATISGEDLVYLRERNSLVSRLTETELAARSGMRTKARL